MYKTDKLIITIISLQLFFSLYSFADNKPDMLFFYSRDCEHCIEVKNEFLPGFLKRYQKHFNLVELEVSKLAYFDSLLTIESRVNFPEEKKDFPAIYFMGTLIEGEMPIQNELETVVKNYLANPDSAKKVDREVMKKVP